MCNLSKGIIIYGASGAGKTTIGKALAKRLGFSYFDFDNYFWDWNTVIPYTVIRPRDEILDRMTKDFSVNPEFVLSGSIGSICKALSSLVDMAALVLVPTEIRLNRVKKREYDMYGNRILEGGDMYFGNLEFYRFVENYDIGEPPEPCLKRDIGWITEAPYPVIQLDGTKDISENVDMIVKNYHNHTKGR